MRDARAFHRNKEEGSTVTSSIIPSAVDGFAIEKSIEYVTSHEETFTANDLFTLFRSETTRPLFEMLRDVVYNYLYNYKGDFSYMVSMKREYLMRGQLSMNQATGVVNCFRAAAMRAATHEKEAAPAPVAANVTTAAKPIEEGIYTIGTDESGSDHVTIKIVPHWEESEAAQGKQVAKFLAGSDNETSYTGFAFIDGTRIIVWKRYRDNVRIVNALKGLMAGSEEERREMGYAYASKSNRCWKCGKTLTVPASQMNGLGPTCYSKVYG